MGQMGVRNWDACGGLVGDTAIDPTIGEGGDGGGEWLGSGVVDTAIGEGVGVYCFTALAGADLVGDAAIGELHRGKILVLWGLTGFIIANFPVATSDGIPHGAVILR